MNTNTKTVIRAKVETSTRDTDLFEITVCVLKRVTLAPFLFVIVLNYLTRKVMREKRKCMGLP